MLWFGGTVTLNGVIFLRDPAMPIRFLLGRFLGAEALGIYGRAYQLISLPTDTLSSSLQYGGKFPTLSRFQSNPDRLIRLLS